MNNVYQVVYLWSKLIHPFICRVSASTVEEAAYRACSDALITHGFTQIRIIAIRRVRQ